MEYLVKDPLLCLIFGNDFKLNFAIMIIVRMLFAVIVAAGLGIERANKRHAAGLRTFMIVMLASTTSGLVDNYLIIEHNVVFPAVSVALAIGMAIISSYTIIYSSRNQIKGLTTAATLWGVAFMGIAFGFGLYTVALVSAIIYILILSALPKAEIFLKNKSNHFEIHLELKNKTDLAKFLTVIRTLGLIVDEIESNPAYANSGLYVYTVSLSIYSKELKKYKNHNEIIDALKSLDYVSYIEEITM